MPPLYERLSTSEQLRLAVRLHRPAHLARTFATFAGQFYDRPAFDALARQARALYAAESDDDAACFRRGLDRRLHDRHHTPVAWELDHRGRRG